MKEIKEIAEIDKSNSIVKIGTAFCGPCGLVAQNLKALEPDFPEIKFYEVDAEEAEDLVSELGIRNVPTLIRYKDGIEAARRVGMATTDQLKEFINGGA